MKKLTITALLLALVLSTGGCAGTMTGITASCFSSLSTQSGGGQYAERGIVLIRDDENAVSLYVNAAKDTTIHLSGTMTRRSGQARLICRHPDGGISAIADSSAVKDKTLSLDTQVALKAGLNCIRFDSKKAKFSFDLNYAGLDTPDIIYYGRSPMAGNINSSSGRPAVPAESPAIPGSEPGSQLPRTAYARYTEVPESAVLLEFDLEKDTDVSVFVAVDIRNLTGGRIKVSPFDLSLKGENYQAAGIIHHAVTDSSWDTFRWNDHNTARLSLPKGSYQLVLSPIKGKNYELLIDAAVSLTKIQ